MVIMNMWFFDSTNIGLLRITCFISRDPINPVFTEWQNVKMKPFLGKIFTERVKSSEETGTISSFHECPSKETNLVHFVLWKFE